VRRRQDYRRDSGTRTLLLVLCAEGCGLLKWWVDASFAVHPNMRGYSGGELSLGKGFPIVSSIKHKLNTRSSTETELVGVDDFMPAICWTRYFLEAQGYGVIKSAILLEQNGKASSSNERNILQSAISSLQTAWK
jgi:hypothetical protein